MIASMIGMATKPLSEREREAFELYEAGMKQADIARKLGVTSARIAHLLADARHKLGLPATTKQKHRYKSAATKRAEAERERSRWFLERFDRLIENEQELVREEAWRVLGRLGIDDEDAAGEYLENHGSPEWCRENLSPEAFGFLARGGVDRVAHDDDADYEAVAMSWGDVQNDLSLGNLRPRDLVPDDSTYWRA